MNEHQETLKRILMTLKYMPEHMKTWVALNSNCLVTELDDIAENYTPLDGFNTVMNAISEQDIDAERIIRTLLEEDESLMPNKGSWRGVLSDRDLYVVSDETLETLTSNIDGVTDEEQNITFDDVHVVVERFKDFVRGDG